MICFVVSPDGTENCQIYESLDEGETWYNFGLFSKGKCEMIRRAINRALDYEENPIIPAPEYLIKAQRLEK